jgi:MYXO-CTERM domain-containing protein
MRRVTLLTAAAFAVAAAPAHAAGGPVPPSLGGAGVSTATDSYVAVGAGPDRSVIMRVRKQDAYVDRSRVLDGYYGVPGVTFDGINTGLSQDGSTLVLAEGRYRATRTRLRVLDPRTLKTTQRLTLPGMQTVDAISPDGRWLYLVDYKNGAVTQYDVRTYDLKARRLLHTPIVDPREPKEKLQGIPVTRVSSPDGRWQYTLYTGEEPFIHALDTVNRTAVCIDVPTGTASRMKLDGNTLTLLQNAAPVARVDLTSFKVAKAAATPVPKPAATPPATTTEDAGPPFALWLIPLALLAALVGLARRRGVILPGRGR